MLIAKFLVAIGMLSIAGACGVLLAIIEKKAEEEQHDKRLR